MPLRYSSNDLLGFLKKLNKERVDWFIDALKKYVRDARLQKEAKALTKIIVNAVNEHGSDFLHWLAVRDEAGLFKYLVSNGIHFDQKDADGLAPLHEATKNKSHRVMKIIMAEDVSYSKENDTPLESEQRDKKGFTPVDYCLKQGDMAGFQMFCGSAQSYWAPDLLAHRTSRMAIGGSHLEKILLKANNVDTPQPDWSEADALPEYKWISNPTAQIVNFANGRVSGRFCSGFMIDESLFMTAGHCVGDVCSRQQQTDGLRLSFNYQYPNGDSTQRINERLFEIAGIAEHGTCEGVDYAIYRLESDRTLTDFGKVTLSLEPPRTNHNIVIAQHPDGLPKKIAEGKVVATNSDVGTISYNADTLGGSSGSPLGKVASKEVAGVHVLGGATENTAISMKRISEYSHTVKQIAQFGFLPTPVFQDWNHLEDREPQQGAARRYVLTK